MDKLAKLTAGEALALWGRWVRSLEDPRPDPRPDKRYSEEICGDWGKVDLTALEITISESVAKWMVEKATQMMRTFCAERHLHETYYHDIPSMMKRKFGGVWDNMRLQLLDNDINTHLKAWLISNKLIEK